jgi:hypothetical protein
MAHGEAITTRLRPMSPGHSASSRPSGRCRARGDDVVPAGVTAGARGHPGGSTGAVDVEIEFAGQSSVAGVVMRSGRPAGAFALPSCRRHRRSTRGRTESQDDGTYQVDGLQDGQYDLIASGPLARISALSAAPPAHFDLPSGSLAGTVTIRPLTDPRRGIGHGGFRP